MVTFLEGKMNLDLHGYPLTAYYNHAEEVGGGHRCEAQITHSRTMAGFGRTLDQAMNSLWAVVKKLPKRG